MAALHRGLRQRDVQKYLTQKKHRSAFAVQRQRVLATPTLATADRELHLQHRRGIGKDPVPKRPHCLRDLLCQCLQSRAHDLVVIPAPRIQ